jgi:hypothetical protein
MSLEVVFPLRYEGGGDACVPKGSCRDVFVGLCRTGG